MASIPPSRGDRNPTPPLLPVRGGISALVHFFLKLLVSEGAHLRPCVKKRRKKDVVVVVVVVVAAAVCCFKLKNNK